MQRTLSTQRFNRNESRPTLSKSPSARAIYINEQTSKKAVNTYFHSPYKEGKPNRQYANPSFVSSHLFYPKDTIEKGQVSSRPNVVPHESDIRKEALYQQRLKTESSQYDKIIQKQQQIRAKIKGQDYKPKGPRFLDSNELLKKQLNNLQNYKEKVPNPTTLPSQQIPPYFEKYRKDNRYQQNFLQYKQREMKNFMAYTKQQKEMKREQMNSYKQKQNQNLQRTIEQFRKDNTARERLQRSKSNLLLNILNEQVQIQKTRNKLL